MFSSTLTTFTNPTSASKLNSPPHASIETAQNDAISQVEKIIGTDASTLGTIIGDLRNVVSAGGGHVQTAAKGGTGQTTYIKGDLLVAQSSSVISKLVVGADGQIPKANSSVATGINWVDDSTPKIAVSSSSVVVGVSTVAEQSVLSVSIPGSVFGTNNVVRATLDINTFEGVSGGSVLLSANFGSTKPVASILLGTPGGTGGYIGKIEILAMGNGATNAQRVNFGLNLATRATSFSSVTSRYRQFVTGTATEDSNASIILGLTSRDSESNASDKLAVTTYVVEKIT